VTVSLERDTVLTQYGRHEPGGFRVRPRRGIETGVSLIAGRLRPEVARALVVRRGIYRPGVDAVRYTTVGDLADAGFDVRADPTPAIPDHVLVRFPGEWDDDVGERFDACFGPVPEEET
jgi:hypothetical protein